MAGSTFAPTRLVVGNWKMNGGVGRLHDFGRLAGALKTLEGVRVVVCPPTTLLHRISDQFADTAILTGGQDCHSEVSGAFTGEVAAEMLVEAGARFVILGHSERRALQGETDVMVSRKARAAVAAGLEPIICVGETWAEREAGNALEAVRGQLRGSLPRELAHADYAIAYEPVWAIGTGASASVDDIAQMHELVRNELNTIFQDGKRAPILYGGSVTSDTARKIAETPGVDGVLVGGASLAVDSFVAILQAAAAAAPKS